MKKGIRTEFVALATGLIPLVQTQMNMNDGLLAVDGMNEDFGVQAAAEAQPTSTPTAPARIPVNPVARGSAEEAAPKVVPKNVDEGYESMEEEGADDAKVGDKKEGDDGVSMKGVPQAPFGAPDEEMMEQMMEMIKADPGFFIAALKQAPDETLEMILENLNMAEKMQAEALNIEPRPVKLEDLRAFLDSLPDEVKSEHMDFSLLTPEVIQRSQIQTMNPAVIAEAAKIRKQSSGRMTAVIPFDRTLLKAETETPDTVFKGEHVLGVRKTDCNVIRLPHSLPTPPFAYSTEFGFGMHVDIPASSFTKK